MTSRIAEIFDSRICKLGEGPLWHPERNQLFWFDILSHDLLSQAPDGTQLRWPMGEHVSAAGWTGQDTLLIASETALFHINLTTGQRELVTPLEDSTPLTRSNDGRADPWGGFWIGTMGKNAEAGAGAIYRWYKGTLRRVVDTVSISNAICFAPDQSQAFYTDTTTQQILSLPLNANTGWPDGEGSVVLDLTATDLNPDGAVTDEEGRLWVAEWGSGRVSCYDADGTRIATCPVSATQSTCPAFGGADLRDLYVTSAAIGLDQKHRQSNPNSGKTFVIRGAGQGRPEPKVML